MVEPILPGGAGRQTLLQPPGTFYSEYCMEADELKRIHEFIEKENFHAAINLSISAMNACRKHHDREGVEECLLLIESIVKRMRQLYSG